MTIKNKIAALLSLSMLAGCGAGSSASTSIDTHSEYSCRTVNYYDYNKPVPRTNDPVADEYFADTFFGGDSRMGSLYLYSDLRDKGAEIWYCESLSLFRIYDMPVTGGDRTLYDLLNETRKNNVYILIGLNEIRSEASFWEGWGEEYSALIQELRTNNPNVNIYLMSSYHPRNVSGLSDEQLTEHLAMLNGKIQEIASENQCYFYDTNDGMLDDANLVKSELVWDGIHLNQNGSVTFGNEVAHHVVQEETYVKKICE